MKIVIAPHIYSSSDKGIENMILYQLVMTKLPSYVSILVPISWEEYLANHPIIASSYELFSLLLDLSVEKFSIDRKAEFIKLQPDILGDCDNLEQIPAKQHIFALCKYDDCKRLYSYVNADTIEVNVSIDRKMKSILHFNPEVSKMDLSMYIQSFSPVLNQLKHDTVSRQYGDKYISAFSAYDRNDERYAKSLLQRAYEDYGGDVDDRTYLYTYDKKYKTFVQFRPNRNNEYHGMDISLEQAKREAPEIVRKYHR